MFLINFNQWKCACVGINNWVILLRAQYKYNHNEIIYKSLQYQQMHSYIYHVFHFLISCYMFRLNRHHQRADTMLQQ